MFVTKDTPENDGEQVRHDCCNVEHKLHHFQSKWEQALQQREQIENDDGHRDEEASEKQKDAADHCKRAKVPFSHHKVVNGGSDDDTGYESLWDAEASSQATQVARWKPHPLQYDVHTENYCGHQGEDQTQNVADAGSADKNNSKDDCSRDDHCGTHGGETAGQVIPVGKKRCQENLPAHGFHHNQEDWHNNAEDPDKFTPDTPRTHHPASEEDNYKSQRTEDDLQEAQDAMNTLEWPTHAAQEIGKWN